MTFCSPEYTLTLHCIGKGMWGPFLNLLKFSLTSSSFLFSISSKSLYTLLWKLAQRCENIDEVLGLDMMKLNALLYWKVSNIVTCK